MLKVITGCMFSAKTEHLISFVRKESYKKNAHIILIKPLKDTRSDDIRTHYGLSSYGMNNNITFLALDKLTSLLPHDGDTIAIDEFQFFSKADADALLTFNKVFDIQIMVAGLALDSRGEDFGSVPYLMARCDEVEMLHAYCHNCGRRATRTQRKKKEGEQIMIGNSNSYEAACLRCWYPQ